ncbi:MAG: putative metal-dependent hydrolase, partial [Dinghuibacter sp.]|nr:putative metal-dependent hydrolase [Dinghuibacter sp.]
YINDIETLPAKLKKAVRSLTPEMLDTPYRPGGWTARQVVHHIGHSHINGFTRLKLALTENSPVIKPYLQDKWVNLPDCKQAEIAPSLKLIESVHASWVLLLKQMKPKDFLRSYIHPEGNVLYTLNQSTGLYAWHSNHHLAHITSLKKRNGWK